MKTFTVVNTTLGDGKYKVAWFDDGVEICSRQVKLAGADEGIAEALHFVAADLRDQNSVLFVDDTIIEPIMGDMLDV